MATWAQIQTAVINKTNTGDVPWEPVGGGLYFVVFRGITILVFPNKVKLKYKGRSRIKVADMTTLRNAIAAFLTDNGEQADLDLLYTILTA